MTDPIRRQKSVSQPQPKTLGDIRQAAARNAADEKAVKKNAAPKSQKVLYGQPPAGGPEHGPTRPTLDASGFLAGLLKAQGGNKNPLVQKAIEAIQQRNYANQLAAHQETKNSIQFVKDPKNAARAPTIQERIARGELELRDPVPTRSRPPVKGS